VARNDEDTRAKYRVVADALRGQIERGLYSIDDVLPSHIDLATEYGVSKEAAADAVRHLEGLGLVRPVHKRGAVVLHRGRRVLDLVDPQGPDDHSLDQDWRELELTTRARPANWPLRVTGPPELALLGDGAQVRTAVRLLGTGRQVEQILATWVVAEASGPVLSWDTVVSSRMPTTDEAKVLAAPGRYPLLRVVRVGRDGGQAHAVAESLVTAQRYEVRCPAPGRHGLEARAVAPRSCSSERTS
jgi:DNA-binding transcriptional regulator YhcF (GntR family)